MFEILDSEKNEFKEGACIRVLGIGGGGCNAVNTMIKSGLSGVDYVVANTDAQALSANLAGTKIQLGAEITKGLGAGANPEVGRKAALDEYEKLSEILEGTDMVFLTAGMGGGTGTGAAPVIAKLCKELGVLTVGVVTKPFLFEGKRRSRQAEAGIATLEESVDSLIVIPNQRLLYIAGEALSLVETFKKADEVLLNAVRGISDLINNTGHINADFADVATVMANKGISLMGTGIASGSDRAIKAATEAISSPLLEDITVDGATGIIINIMASSSLTMHETNEAVTLVMDAADDDAEIIFGTVIDEDMEDDIKVTVIATGLNHDQKSLNLSSSNNLTKTQRLDKAPREEITSTEVSTREVRPENSWPNTEAKGEEVWSHETQTRETWSPEASTRGTRQAEVQRTETPVREEKREHSSLIESIKEAAHNYQAQKSETRENFSEGASEGRVLNNQSNKAKEIARKLGFINFDEDELDTPTFLRKEDSRREEKRETSQFTD